MSAHVVISDALLEAMLARRANLADPGDLRDEVFARIDVTEPRRSWLGLQTGSLLRGWSVRRATLIAVAVALLLAAVAGALVGARLLDATPRTPLVPTGIDVLVSAPGWYTHLVADGEGIAWLREDTGALVRFDPATRSRRSWTVADDAVFAASAIIPARDGGIWLIGRRTLTSFDGEGFRDVIELPSDLEAASDGDVVAATEAPDGSLWAATPDGTVLHWDGSSWTRLAAPRADLEVCTQPDATCYPGAITVDAAGRVWIGWAGYPDPPGGGWISRYDGSAWAVFEGGDAWRSFDQQVRAISQVPDGAILVVRDDGAELFDGRSWTDATGALDGRCTSSLAGALDGAFWCVGPGSSEGAVAAWRFDGRAWVSGGEADGLLETELATVVPTKDATFVGVTGDASAIHALVDGRWEQHPSQDSGPKIAGDGRPVLAISRDELLAIGQDGGVWHFNNGAWTLGAIDPEHPGGMVRDLELAPDGTPWAASEDGVAYWRDGQWVVIDAEPANVVTVDEDGTAWVARTGSGCDLWALRFNGATWAPSQIPRCPSNVRQGGQAGSLAVDGHGALWVGAGGFVVDALARWSEGRWETFDASDGVPDNIGVEVLGVSAAGDVWIGFRPSDGSIASGYARFDGTEWTVIEAPGGLVLAPDGTPWAAADRGPARYDGKRWTFSYPPVSIPGRITVALDGTVFADGTNGMATSIWRFPAPVP
jgi:hypothetical protein